MAVRDLHQLAQTAYIYGYPLVYNITEVTSQTTAPKVPYVGPVNLFGYATELAGPKDEFVSLNNDTLYSFAHCDITDEPLVLHVPDTNDRYYVMQFVDPWTNNFAYVGRRATGTREGHYLISAPGWSGDVPENVIHIPAPNSAFSIIGRYAVNGADDIPNVARLQADTCLTPLSRFPEPPVTGGRAYGDHEIAPYNTEVVAELRFWEQLRAWIALFPPPDSDQQLLRSLAPLGLLGGPDTYVNPDQDLANLLVDAAARGQEAIEQMSRKGHVAPVNGWIQGLHSFDYNTERLGLGTIDSPEWKIADPKQAYGVRAAIARVGLWGNHGYEADYANVFVDDSGQPLTGQHEYVLHFDQPPPVDAFWSITMYNLPKYYLVDNAINRYSIGDRTPGVRFNEDGSLDIYIQFASPGPDRESNWLPTPPDDFRPILRMYQPRAAVMEGSYILPPIKRIG